MDKVLLPANHYFFESAEKIQRICSPFFTQYQISFFDYARFYKQGDFYGLTVNADSFRIFFELEYEPIHFCKDTFFENGKFYYHFSTPQNFDGRYSFILKEVNKITKSDHGFILSKKQDDYIDTYFFCSSRPVNQAINYYLNLLPVFEKFLTYFQGEASELLNNADENRIILPSKMLPDAWKNPPKEPAKFLQAFKNKNLIRRFSKSNKPELTKRQIDCLLYLVKGLTLKEIAKETNLAPKTVEHYLNAVKDKLNCHSRSSLITTALSLPVIKERIIN